MFFSNLFLIVSLISIAQCRHYNPYFGHKTDSQDNSWEFFVFSQFWPITSCIDWKDRNDDHTCDLPKKDQLWTVHGVWPSRNHSSPSQCSNVPFRLEQLQPIRSDLERYWPDIRNQGDNLWKHEWEKHGTCAMVLPKFDTELKYFSQGVNLAKTYQIGDLLAAKKIVPRQKGYDLNTIINAVYRGFEKVSSVRCIFEKSTRRFLLSEIRFCFDKNLDMIDCSSGSTADGLFNHNDRAATNCNYKKPVYYLNSLKNL